jgi:hypothetical protein
MFASHDYDRATDIATRTVVIAGGRIQDDQPAGPRLAPRVGLAAQRDLAGSVAGGPSWVGDDTGEHGTSAPRLADDPPPAAGSNYETRPCSATPS